jgi:hypothetical protein
MITCPECHRFVKHTATWVDGFDNVVRVEAVCKRHGEVAADWTDYDEVAADWTDYDEVAADWTDYDEKDKAQSMGA